MGQVIYYYKDFLMQDVKLAEVDTGIKIARRKNNSIDVWWLEARDALLKVKEDNAKAGLLLSV